MKVVIAPTIDGCRNRSAFHRRPMPHQWTTVVRVAGQPEVVRCSWCWTAKP